MKTNKGEKTVHVAPMEHEVTPHDHDHRPPNHWRAVGRQSREEHAVTLVQPYEPDTKRAKDV